MSFKKMSLKEYTNLIDRLRVLAKCSVAMVPAKKVFRTIRVSTCGSKDRYFSSLSRSLTKALKGISKNHYVNWGIQLWLMPLLNCHLCQPQTVPMVVAVVMSLSHVTLKLKNGWEKTDFFFFDWRNHLENFQYYWVRSCFSQYLK